jgi:hypothetical protein
MSVENLRNVLRKSACAQSVLHGEGGTGTGTGAGTGSGAGTQEGCREDFQLAQAVYLGGVATSHENVRCETASSQTPSRCRGVGVVALLDTGKPTPRGLTALYHPGARPW